MELQNSSKIIVFELNGEKYSADIKEVERILLYTEPTVLPDSPAFVKGVINHEDRIIPIISLQSKFRLPDTSKPEIQKIIVIKREEKKFGIIVDDVDEVIEINKDGADIEKAPEIINDRKRDYILGLLKMNGKIIIMLDLEKILTVQEEQKIFEEDIFKENNG